MIYKSLIVVLIMFISGCATEGDRFEDVIHLNKMKFDAANNEQCLVSEQKLFENAFVFNSDCFEASTCPFFDERESIKSWPPEVGLALSGGGTRSASFSIGVLKALDEQGVLDKVDVISAVSGGAYATYWYYSQLFYQDKIASIIPNATYTKETMFSRWSDQKTNLADPNDYRFQHTLEESSDIMAHLHKSGWWESTKVGLQYGFQTAFQLLSTPFHWIAGGLFDWELNMTPFFYFYKDGLDRTYGYVPLDYRLEHFANAKSNLSVVDNIDAEPIPLSKMKEFIQEKNNTTKTMPYFIINTTARYGAEFIRGQENVKRTMENTVFEFTPWGCFSTLLGINKQVECPKDVQLNENNELDFSRIVAISGAAVDGQVESIDIAGNGERSNEIWKKSLLDISLDIANLNMGYHLENPSFSIVHKWVHRFLPWPIYLADDYLLGSHESSFYLSDGGHSDNSGVFSLIRRGVKKIYIVDAEQDGGSIFESAKRLNNTIKRYGLKLSIIQQKPLNVRNADKSVFQGKIETIDGRSTLSEIIYIKLSVSARHKQGNSHSNTDLPFSVRSYMEDDPKFPHHSTADIFYSPAQFKAYRDLGYKVTCSLGRCQDDH